MDVGSQTLRESRGLDPIAIGALAGDRSAEREVCRRLSPAIRAFAQRRLSHAAAEDFAHDVMLLLIEALREGRIDDPSRLAGFALGICRNLARERARSGERRRELLAKYAGQPQDAEQASLERPEELSPAVRRGHLEDCYSQLTEHARNVLRATFGEDRGDTEIAEELALSAANVRVIRHRSLSALRSCLERPISWSQG